MADVNTAKAIFLGLCPRCGQGPLFDGYIALRKQCPACALDYAMFDAGDGPMVFGILIVGAIVCGLALWVEFTFQPQGRDTLVSWTMTGKDAFVAKIFCLLCNRDRMCADMFDQGLAKLKGVCESA